MIIYFTTLGCPKNFNDTEVAKGILVENSYTITDDIEEADVIVVNTCGFINDAKVESINQIIQLMPYKEEGKKLVVSGCLTKRYAKELMEEMPEVDLFIGVNEYAKLPELLKDLDNRKALVEEWDGCPLGAEPRKYDDNPYSATLKIAEGCNNRCTYCAIPDIRGGFRSKPMDLIIEEAKLLADKGCKELILIAQDLTLYGYDLYGEYKLSDLVRQLAKIDKIKWIRLMYCYEDRINDELIKTIKEEAKVCKYLDIPIQHISNGVLKAMHRRSTSDSIKTTLAKLRKEIPDINIRTTLIIGFPGESEEDFEELLDFVEDEKFERLGCFAYSMEDNTPAAKMEKQIDEDVKQERVDAIMRRQLDISLEHNKEKIGRVLDVLVEEVDDTKDNSYIGRTQYDAPEIDNSVIFTSLRALKAGDFLRVRIIDAFDYDLVGTEEA
ncbi:MAG: 30S ribosomal protein S12 methylthiotransferase RimO [Clostridia bacterium]|nr:30S ribosomal protein S12 methylthiotransferase RimO [Clostridia bacterium]